MLSSALQLEWRRGSKIQPTNLNHLQVDPVKSEKVEKPSRWMPDAVRKYHERRDSADRVPVAGDSPEDYMSPIVSPSVRIPCFTVLQSFSSRLSQGFEDDALGSSLWLIGYYCSYLQPIAQAGPHTSHGKTWQCLSTDGMNSSVQIPQPRSKLSKYSTMI